MSSARLLIFIVTYNAESHIAAVLDRIPREYWDNSNTEVLIIDDASQDNTIEVCKEYRQRTGHLFTLLKNPINQGYGGNQKIGYAYAVKNAFDVVVLLHGDGQYPPEMIGHLIEPILTGPSDACFGSRMINKSGALKGGMPYYKFVANILLTRLQNWLVGTHLSEFHSGFRAYRVAALAALPIRYNSNDFDFDTDIIIQFVHTKKTIHEITIPTHYGNEVCHVNGLKYARQIIITSILSKLQRYQIYYHPKFNFEGALTFYPSKTGFDSSHRWAIDMVTTGATVIDIGLGSGAVAKSLVEEKQARIIGYDYHIDATAANYCIATHTINFDQTYPDMAGDGHIDYVLLLDVLEHLSDPESFIRYLREHLSIHGSTLLISTANVGFITMRLSLLLGRFNYGKRGILDFTHKRLFTFSSLKKLLEQEGFTIDAVDGIPVPFEFILGDNGLSRLCAKANRILIWISKSLFSFQIVMKVNPLPTLNHLLLATERH